MANFRPPTHLLLSTWFLNDPLGNQRIRQYFKTFLEFLCLSSNYLTEFYSILALPEGTKYPLSDLVSIWPTNYRTRAISGRSRLVAAPLRNHAKRQLLPVFCVIIGRPKK